jgi:hypothetical protein
LPINTQSVDLECPLCGEKYQVKTLKKSNTKEMPAKLIGAAWKPQLALVSKNSHPGIFLVLLSPEGSFDTYFISKEIQRLECFEVRKPLSEKAKSPGWVGFMITTGNLAGKPKWLGSGIAKGI